MQTEVKKLEGLKCELKVTISVDQVNTAYKKCLKEIGSKAKIAGFRPGKVPTDVIEKKYGQELRSEVAGELMQLSFESAVTENSLLIAGAPNVEPGEIVENQPFEYVATFETYPKITLKDLTDIKLKKSVAEVGDDDVAKMLEKIQKEHAEWFEVDRAAADGDRLLIDFEGFIGKETFEGGSAKDFNLELGSKQMIPGFEDGLIGAKPKETKKVKVTFPAEYPVENLAGKKTVFEVTVHKVEEAKLPELNDALAEKAGVKDGIEALKSEVRKGIERELHHMLESQMKKQVLDKLVELNPIEVPDVLLDLEIKNLQQMTRQQMAMQKGSKELPDANLPRDPYIEQAKKRVTLGLLLAEVIKAYDITVDKDLVRQKVEEIAKAYSKPEEVIAWYYNNQKMLSEVEALVVEDQAIANLLGKAKIEELPSTYGEVVSASQNLEGVK